MDIRANVLWRKDPTVGCQTITMEQFVGRHLPTKVVIIPAAIGARFASKKSCCVTILNRASAREYTAAYLRSQVDATRPMSDFTRGIEVRLSGSRVNANRAEGLRFDYRPW